MTFDAIAGKSRAFRDFELLNECKRAARDDEASPVSSIEPRRPSSLIGFMRRRRRVNKRDQASAFCASRSPATRRALTPTGPYKGSISLIPIESLIALKRARPCLYGITKVQSRVISRVDCISVLTRIY